MFAALAAAYYAAAGRNRELGGEPAPRAETYVSGFEVVHTYPHDPSQFTQGLAFAPDGTLWESDGLYRHSVVRQVDIESGRSLKTYPNPSNIFGEGAVVHDNKLIQLSWKENKIHEFSLPDLKLLRAVDVHIGKEGWGLASDGHSFYVTDSGHELFVVEPHTYRVLRRMPIVDPAMHNRIHGVNELEWVNGTQVAARLCPRLSLFLSLSRLAHRPAPASVSCC